MKRNFLERPYTEQDAKRFEQTFKAYGLVASPDFETKQKTNFQKGDGKTAWNNLKAIIADVADIYHEANRTGGSNFQVQELGRYVAFRTQTTMIPGPIKSRAGAFRKLGLTVSKKEGEVVAPEDRYSSSSDLKDIVRVTLVGENDITYKNAVSKLLTTCTALYKMSVRKNGQIFADKDACGYSGANIVAVLPCKYAGEVQVNNRHIMFGKMSKNDFCRDLDVSTDCYKQLADRVKLEGGLGHTFYEIYREDKKGPNGLEAARLSKLYYEMLRNPFEDKGWRMQFRRALNALKKDNPETEDLHWPAEYSA